MKVVWLFLLSVAPVLAGCDAVRPLGAGEETGAVAEVAVFEGGYGIHWHQKVAGQFNALQARRAAEAGVPARRVELWGDPRVIEKVKPRLLRGNPPDLLLIYDVPIWVFIAAGKLRPFDAALEKKAYGSDRIWRECFIPGTLDNYSSGGKVYAVPSTFTAWGCWYDARMFREHGWAVPRDWNEFNTLCENIKESGIAPIAFQGKYPRYAWYTFVSLMQRCAGVAGINRINQFAPGAFTHPDIVHAARLLQEMALRHYQKGAMAMTHTESQLQFVNGHAAMVFCGVWLYNEMKESIPPGFEMRCFDVPGVPDGRGNPRVRNAMGAEFLFVPTDAGEAETAFDFARYMVSPATAPAMSASIGVISPLRGGTPPESVDPPLRSVLQMLNTAGGIFRERVSEFLLDWQYQVMAPAIAGLMRGELTPEAFCGWLERGVQNAIADLDRQIPEYRPYDPARFGEAV